MTQQAHYLIQILEKIGNPLMTSILRAKPVAQANDQEVAADMASLLAKATQLSIELGNITELSKAGIDNDSVRVALAALAGPLVGEIFAAEGKIPDDNDLKKISSAFQAVLSFADNFTPSPESEARLSVLQANGMGVDTHQATIQYINAFTPVITAIAAFSFGQPEQKIVMEVASKLVAKTADFNTSIFGKLSEDAHKQLDLVSIRTLAELYAACHKTETQRLTGMSEEERAAQPQAPGGGLSLDTVWAAFDIRMAMLSAVAKSALPANLADAAAQAPQTAPVAPATPPVESAPLPASPPPAQETPPPPPASPAETPQQTQGQGSANPMSMFAKKEDAAPAETPPPASPPPTQESPPATPPPAQETPPPPPVPPTQTPTENTEQNDSSDDRNSDGGEGNPMSFFKK